MYYLNAASVTETSKNWGKPENGATYQRYPFFSEAALLRPLKMLDMNLYTCKRKELLPAAFQ